MSANNENLSPLTKLSRSKEKERAAKADKAAVKANEKFSTNKPSAKQSCPKKPSCPEPGTLGALSAQEESGPAGSSAIGYDTTGGFSYGKYQIETKSGTMKDFLKYAKSNNPDISSSLEKAGGYDAALAGKETFKDAWKKAAKTPGFEKLEHDFQKEINYDYFVGQLKEKINFDPDNYSATIRDVVWSCSVQHGKNSKVVINAFKKKNITKMSDTEIIDAIYDERTTVKKTEEGNETLKYFENSTANVQKSIKERLSRERACAQYMLAREIESINPLIKNLTYNNSYSKQSIKLTD